MQKNILILLFIFSSLCVNAKTNIISGPMLGYVELRTAKVWVEIKDDCNATLTLSETGKNIGIYTDVKEVYNFKYVVFNIVGLEPNTTYHYTITSTDKKKISEKESGEFKTTELWQFRKPAPDVTFLTGSCAYINQPEYDRPGKPYGGDPKIFEKMGVEKSDACIWLGDNWYYREVDFGSPWGLWYRPSHDRATPEMHNLLKNMPHYAIWDDHDYGPNNSDLSYILKDDALDVFKTFWPNPSYGVNKQGIFTRISLSDADIFLMDDRWWRSNDDLKDSINGLPNPDKIIWGKEQLNWLKASLQQSNATFKIIATGSQMLNEISPYDCNCHATIEYNDFLNFLSSENINGVLFFSGDRHHSSIIKKEIPDFYNLYDITVSAFTSGSYPFGGIEKNNPNRILGIAEKQNYGKVSISGEKKNRELKIEFVGLDGNVIDSWKINEKELKARKKEN